MIVKVQLPLFSSEAELDALVYDEHRTFEGVWPVTREVRQLFKRGEVKAYFHARIKGYTLLLGKRAPDQKW